ncbi:sperm axonemal maintenance protein CFAP97D1-like isoform X2 [Heptranchias perlo]|uniref:sperm axonemal maintenance protein CFAP97D1-like isoform X2 n=1 Tax=Heptranchias perlo TaxID=212740 RepID=UPI00355AC683
MHRAYQPIVPTSNKYLQQKWDKDDYQKHRTKVQKATAVVDTKGPQTPVHLQVKLKTLQIQEERLAIITRDNQILSSKLAAIMRSNGTVENWNNYSYKSLNAEKRQRELMQISRENQAILQRIMHCESEYNRSRLKEDWEKAERVQKDIARYPRGLKTVQKSKKKVRIRGWMSGETSDDVQEQRELQQRGEKSTMLIKRTFNGIQGLATSADSISF